MHVFLELPNTCKFQTISSKNICFRSTDENRFSVMTFKVHLCAKVLTIPGIIPGMFLGTKIYDDCVSMEILFQENPRISQNVCMCCVPVLCACVRVLCACVVCVCCVRVCWRVFRTCAACVCCVCRMRV